MSMPDFNEEQRTWIAQYRLHLLTLVFTDLTMAGGCVWLAMIVTGACGSGGASRVFSDVLWGIMLALAVVLWRKHGGKGVQS